MAPRRIDDLVSPEAERPKPPLRGVTLVAIGLTVILVSVMAYLAPGRVSPRPAASPRSSLRPTPAPVYHSMVPTSTNEAYVVIVEGQPATLAETRLFQTRDGGKTWIALPLPVVGPEEFVGLRQLADHNLLLQTADYRSHFYMRDGGTWKEIQLPGPPVGLLQMVDSRVGFYSLESSSASQAVYSLHLYRTVDGGQQWVEVLTLDGYHPTAGGLSVKQLPVGLAFTTASRGWIVRASEPSSITCGRLATPEPSYQLLTTDDGGAHWTAVPLPVLPNGNIEVGTPTFTDAGSAGYLVITARIYQGVCPPAPVTFVTTTLDGGAMWSAPAQVPSEFFASLDSIHWWAADVRRVLRSRDRGSHWETIVPKLPGRDVRLGQLVVTDQTTAWSFWNPGLEAAAGVASSTYRQALLRTTDGGRTWSEIRLPPHSKASVSPA